MLLRSLALFSLATVFAAVFHVKDLVMTKGLTTEKFDRRVALVVGDASTDDAGTTRYPVIAWMGLNAAEPFSASIRVKAENLVTYDYFGTDMPKSRQQAEFWADFKAKYPTTYESQRVDVYQEERLDQFALMIHKISGGNPEELLRNQMLSIKARLIGGAVLEEAEHSGMVAVAEHPCINRAGNRYCRTMEHIWAGIGDFIN